MNKIKKSRPTYSAEFKEQAAAKCLELGAKKTSEELGVCTASLRKWMKQQDPSVPKSDKNQRFKELEEENRRLKKELGYVNEINDILKKSTAIFSKKVMDDLK